MAECIKTRIDILRHGLPEGHGCLRGHTDFPITPTGLSQMSSAVKGLDDIEQVIASPLQRCSEFANQFAQQFALPCQHFSHWKEMNFGDWDGQSHDSLWQQHRSLLETYWQNPWLSTPHGGETLKAFDRRIQQAWDLLLDNYLGQKILLVTHAGVMKQLMRILLEMPENTNYLHRIDLPYAARYRVTVTTDENGMHWPQIQWPVEQQY
ncbi:histidine phosphatase family protein [Photobacterium sp. DNB22_13_2]